jgi:hypothetical protein
MSLFVNPAAINTVEAIGLVSSMVSIALAVFAIWQAMVFYRWSDTASKEAAYSARDMRASVVRIEKLFDTFYSDTFGLMKDTYADFRKHTWPTQAKTDGGKEMRDAAERVASEKIEGLKQELRKDIEKLSARGESTEEVVESMRRDVTNLIDRAIDESRQVNQEAEADVIRPAVEKRITELKRRGQSRIEAFKFARPFLEDEQLEPAFEELYKLRDEGEASFTINPEPDTSWPIPTARAEIRFEFD